MKKRLSILALLITVCLILFLSLGVAAASANDEDTGSDECPIANDLLDRLFQYLGIPYVWCEDWPLK